MIQNRPVATKQAILPPIDDPTVHAEIERLARRYLDAGGIAMSLLHSVGGQAETLIERLPKPLRKRIDVVTYAALGRAFDAASRSRRVMCDRGELFNRLLSSASGAAGGVAGLPGAMIELPLTVTLLLRAILDIAAEHGFDPESEAVRIEALQVLATAGPLAEDDATDLGLLAARLTITGQTVNGLIGKVAPKLAASLAQKLGAQALPLLGAAAGATINYTFTRYYQELARVNFGLMRLERETGLPRAALDESFGFAVGRIRAGRRG